MPAGADLITAVLRRLDESVTGVFWTRSEILVYLNEALKEIALVSGFNRQPITRQLMIPCTAIPQVTGLEPDKISILRIERQSDGKPLQRTMIGALDHRNPSWATNQSGRPTHWFPMGLNKFGLYPAANQAVTILALSLPGVITDTAGVLPFPVYYTEAAIEYAYGLARLKEGLPEATQAADSYYLYLVKLAAIEGIELATQPLKYQPYGGYVAQQISHE